MMLAPSSSAASATSVLYVSTESGIFKVLESFFITGRMRRISSLAEMGREPGREDSPPTSTRCAPSRSILSACKAAVSGSKNKPPSLKESGVTFRIPMIFVSDPRQSAWEFTWRLNVGRRYANDSSDFFGGQPLFFKKRGSQRMELSGMLGEA